MISTFNKDEKKALIAILKYMVNSEGIIEENELVTFMKIAEEKGFEDFHSIFNEVDSTILSLDDLTEQIKKVTDVSHQKDIIALAIDMATANGIINPGEADILSLMSKEWEQ